MKSITETFEKVAKNEGITITALESRLGASKGVLSRAITKKTDIQAKWLLRLVENYPQYNTDWILTQKGEMLKNSENLRNLIGNKAVSYGTTEQKRIGIPLIPIDAIAGIASGDVSVTEMECEEYDIPEFNAKADYMIRISGNSMAPTYNTGDIVACKKLPTNTFFQWGKVYVLDTIQGPLCKRVNPSDKGDGYLLIESDNPKYKSFNLPVSEIRSLGLVIGLVRLE